MKKVKLDNVYKERKIRLEEFNSKTSDEQYAIIENTLKEMYEGKIDVSKSYIMKCLKLSVAKEDDYVYLSNNLVVEKDVRELFFHFKKQGKKWPIFALLLTTLIIGIFSATYSGLLMLEYMNLNKDIDGDGIADINLDLNDDRKPEINIDYDGDDKPDTNIDYKGNRENIFNVDEDGDGEPDKNLVNDATDGKPCEVNCDVDGDGWPDYNYDIDGDGKPDLDIDTDDDGEIDASIDIDGDMICDIMCDDDGDGVCDRNCTAYEGDNIHSGSSTVTGNEDSNINSGKLNVIYENHGELLVDGLLPDDHPDSIQPVSKFSITNMSDFSVIYKLTLVVEKNTFLIDSENFMYKIDSNNGGFTADYKVAPGVGEVLLTSYVEIPANATQEYEVTFKLHGTGAPQNYDQGKTFLGHVKVGD